ncbi:MAG: LytTR family DNA-binding domain-containing protein [Agriterribacter sp.]
MQKISCIVVEDSHEDSQYLQHLINGNDHLELKGDFSNVIAASSYLRAFPPQIIFMDIDMPGMNGMDYFKQSDTSSDCIFVTAHSEYAVDSYEALAFDYLMKPVKKERFDDCIERYTEYRELKRRSDIFESTFQQNTISIPEGTGRHIVPVSSIVYIEALRDYCKIITTEKKIITSSTLKHFTSLLPATDFIRIHRSYVVNRAKATKVDLSSILMCEGTRLPIGKTFKHTF